MKPQTSYVDPGIKKGIGILLLVLGVIGLFLPILQGTLMILAGVAVLKGGSIKDNLKDMKNKLKRR